MFAGWEGATAGPRARPQLQLTSAGFAGASVAAADAANAGGDERAKGRESPREPSVVGAIALLGGVLYWSQQGAGSAKTPDTTAPKPPVVVAADSVPAAVTKPLPRLDSASFLRAQKAADSPRRRGGRGDARAARSLRQGLRDG